MFKRILVPVDGSETSTKALVAALQLARERDASVRVIHVLDELAYLTGYEYSATALEEARKYAQKTLDDAVAIAQSSGVPADGKLLETPGRRLGDVVADEVRALNADLVVVGTHGRRGMSRVLLGSGAEQVIRVCPVPVLTIRAAEPA
ncbi:universal stress protein [Ramlibacter sp. XY19]|uniref:universal stress protein n=1 Tax=Ramlibacter paludis TaxID=2908000 RepID=UPI0023DC119D|nr:universal stress protein [Ramlibacter paludis]MCG2595534.1 universal stress protein [Ramlibacter paludis]